MIRLIALNNPRVAQAFIDYMASRHIEIQMMPEGGNQFALWLVDDQHQVEAEAELNLFLQNPRDAKYQAASWTMAESRQSKFYYRSPSMMAMIRAKAGPLTLSVMAVCAVIFALAFLGMGNQIFDALHFRRMRVSNGSCGAGSATRCCISR